MISWPHSKVTPMWSRAAGFLAQEQEWYRKGQGPTLLFKGTVKWLEDLPLGPASQKLPHFPVTPPGSKPLTLGLWGHSRHRAQQRLSSVKSSSKVSNESFLLHLATTKSQLHFPKSFLMVTSKWHFPTERHHTRHYKSELQQFPKGKEFS
jgi:hypothetical protein